MYSEIAKKLIFKILKYMVKQNQDGVMVENINLF